MGIAQPQAAVEGGDAAQRPVRLLILAFGPGGGTGEAPVLVETVTQGGLHTVDPGLTDVLALLHTGCDLDPFDELLVVGLVVVDLAAGVTILIFQAKFPVG